MMREHCLTKSLFLMISCLLYTTTIGSTASPYSVNFDLRDMTGFDDNTISSDDIEAYIQDKYPNSPLLSEANIGSCFIRAGQSNDVNPAFLVATAELEGRFGTAGWAASHPECHNTLGYDIRDDGPGKYSCLDSWCAMIQRVASVIAIGDNYYTDHEYTVSQIRGGGYATKPNSEAIADFMNNLYTFSINRKTVDGDTPIAVDVYSIGTPQSDVKWEEATPDQDISQVKEEQLESISVDATAPQGVENSVVGKWQVQLQYEKLDIGVPQLTFDIVFNEDGTYKTSEIEHWGWSNHNHVLRYASDVTGNWVQDVDSIRFELEHGWIEVGDPALEAAFDPPTPTFEGTINGDTMSGRIQAGEHQGHWSSVRISTVESG